MRISDWSSDVCSSDLDSFVVTMTDVTAQIKAAKLLEQSKEELEKRVDERTRELRRLNEILQDEVRRHEQTAADLERARKAAEAANLGKTRFLAADSRSEEHTSELQSLMRISYAVFCLKKKN